MDILNRSDLERKLARVVGRDLRLELRKLLNYLGDPPQLENVPRDYWQNGWRDIQRDVEPVLLDIYLSQAEAMMNDVGIGVEWDMINSNASQWAKQNTKQMLMDLFGKRYAHLNEVIPRFYNEGWNLGQLQADLEKWYSPVRAEMIAVTETTRAAVEGERAMVAELEKTTGRRMVPVWMTNKDERVCPICGPKHGKEITDGRFPPAHPRCRCWTNHRFSEDNK